MAKLYKGWGVKLYKDSTEIGYATSATIEIAANPEAAYQIGSFKPVEIRRGNLEISGTIERACVDNELISLITDSGTLTEFNFTASLVTPTPETSGEIQYIKVIGCVPETGSLDIPQDGIFTESIDFIAKDFEIKTVS